MKISTKDARALALFAVVALLAACRSEPVHYYTLLGTSVESGAGARASFQIAVETVDVPAQVDVPQLVIRQSAGQLAPVDGRRWIAPLSAELRSALSADLQHELGARDVSGIAPAAGVPVYRVKLSVQRFDSLLDRSAQIDALWSIEGPAGATLSCASQSVEPAGAGYEALTQAHQRALAKLAHQIALGAGALRTAPKVAACPAAST
jgi:uncharacterized lipoprotein YmbA